MANPVPFQPYVPAAEQPPELTFRALFLGAILGIAFGAASTYLALKVGLTVSASVPAAVVAIALLRARQGNRAILEHNVAQTVASAGESVAAAVVFTVPALIFLGYPLDVGRTTLIALTGGLLGVLMMVPLRRYLIVREHGTLRYPEGRACAEILIAGAKGGGSALRIFCGILVGVASKGLVSIVAGVKGYVGASFQTLYDGARDALGYGPGQQLSYLKHGSVSCELEPPLFGVGYIIGFRTSVMMAAGSLLAAWVLIPMIAFFGSGMGVPGADPNGIGELGPDGIWDKYVRYIGAGAVATGGILGLFRALPAIGTSLGSALGGLFKGGSAGMLRTDRDTPLPLLLLGAAAILVFIRYVPAFQMTWLGALIILALGFLFSVVSSRITGEVGSTSCPLSGMTIGVLMATCAAFLAAGMEGPTYARLALTIGAVVCIAISNAGTCSQDLKTGYLVGATPVRQQGALLIGVLASVVAIGWTAHFLNSQRAFERTVVRPFAVDPAKVSSAESARSLEPTDATEYRYVRLLASEVPKEAEVLVPAEAADGEAAGTPADAPQAAPAGNYLVDPASNLASRLRVDGIGGKEFPAPQARLMSTVIDGLLNRTLPWDLILLGVAIALFIEILGFRSLTFAVGVYLPLSSTLPVFLGGLARRVADKVTGRVPDADDEPNGVLFCSGLIAGAALLGIAASGLPALDPALVERIRMLKDWRYADSDLFAVLVIVAITCAVFLSAFGKAGQRPPTEPAAPPAPPAPSALPPA